MKRLYSIYCLSVFGGLFVLLLPIFAILIQKKSWRKQAIFLNHYWARGFFRLCFIRVDVEFRQPINPNEVYIFCANHFSFLDIPIMGLTPVPFAFVGKNSMGKIPLFGYMYRKLHILVDRDNIRSRYETVQKSLEALNEGLNLAIFPEGGIMTKDPPNMSKFKPGAFKTAIESKVPVVPVTIPYNWLFLPDDNRFLPHYRRLKVIFHEPIKTETYSLDGTNDLSKKVFNIIAGELRRWNTDENHERNLTEDSAFSSVGGSNG